MLRRFRNRVISGPFGELDRIAARPDAGSSLEGDIDQIADAYGSTELAPPTLARTVGIAFMQGKTG